MDILWCHHCSHTDSFFFCLFCLFPRRKLPRTYWPSSTLDVTHIALSMCIVFMCPPSWVLEEMQRDKNMKRVSSEIVPLETSESRQRVGLLDLIPLRIITFSLCVPDFFRLLNLRTGETAQSPLLDPCLPTDLQDEIGPPAQRLHLRGTGDFDQCRQILQPFLNRTNVTQTSLSGVYQPGIDYTNSQFYGFSEFYYCTEDVLRMGGDYNASKYTQAAKVSTASKSGMHGYWVTHHYCISVSLLINVSTK